MEYHAPTKSFTVTPEALNLAAMDMIYAIRHIRDANGLNLKGYKCEGGMQSPQFAEQGILDAAKALGINLGTDRHGKLDVSEPE